MITPEVFKVYSNNDYKVYKSTFEGHYYVIIRKSDKMVALAEEYNTMGSGFKFDHKLEASF
jgi:hypothetical protein